MLLDVLSGLDKINIATAYRYKGKELSCFPSQAEVLEQVEPVYETVDGWMEETISFSHCYLRIRIHYMIYLKAVTNTLVQANLISNF